MTRFPVGPDGTALLVVDMQNAYLDERGSFARTGFDVRPLRAAIPGCVELVRAARVAGVPVLHVRYAFAPDGGDLGIMAVLDPTTAGAGSRVDGTWDAAFVPELTPAGGETVLTKHRFSAFWETGLDGRLRDASIGTVVLAGIMSNVCVESTARDACQADYATVVVSDATASLTADAHAAALDNLRLIFGDVTTVDRVRNAWAPHPAGRVS